MATKEGNRDFRPFIPECSRRGIGKTLAYELANDGLIETFTIGRKRFVVLESLDRLPENMAKRESAGREA